MELEEAHLLADNGAGGEDVWIEDVQQRTVPPNPKTRGAVEQPSLSKWGTFFRAVGLKAIPALWMTGNGLQEPRKVIIQHNHWSALRAASVHIIPVLGVVLIVTLNLRGHMLGSFMLDNLVSSSGRMPALQFAAKLHELFMVASLTTFVFSAVSSELCLRNGMPYGVIFSGLQVRQPSFLVSPEMLALFKSDEIPKLVMMKLGIVIFVAISLGSAVGPASAIVMIPRLKVSPVGSTAFWLNATFGDLFPASLDGTMVSPSCANITGWPSLSSCPSSGWEALSGFVSFSGSAGLHGALMTNWESPSTISYPEGSFPDKLILLPGPSTSRSMYSTNTDGGPGSWSNSRLITTQNAALAAALSSVDQMWRHLTQFSDDTYSEDISHHNLKAPNPYAAVNCTGNHTVDGSNDIWPIPFLDENNRTSKLTTMDVSDILQNQGNGAKPNVLFVDLTNLNSSDSGWEDVSLGAVILNGNQSVVTCIIHSGWVPTSLQDSNDFVDALNDISTLDSSSVKISPSWADSMNPIIDDSGSRVFGSLSASFVGQDKAEDTLVETYQLILAALVANGLANIGIDSTLQGNLTHAALCLHYSQKNTTCDYSNTTYFTEPPDAQAKEWVNWQVKHGVLDLAYSSDGVLAKLSITILLIYALVAILHTIRLFTTNNSSSSWQSVSELTTLALVSPQPPKDLDEMQNTSAGIYGLGAFKKNVRVAAVDGEKGGEKGREELQLVFGKEMPQGYRKVELNEEYGALP